MWVNLRPIPPKNSAFFTFFNCRTRKKKSTKPLYLRPKEEAKIKHKMSNIRQKYAKIAQNCMKMRKNDARTAIMVNRGTKGRDGGRYI